MMFYIYATSEDHALELSGNGADDEFASILDALDGFQPDYHEGREIYAVTVEKVVLNGDQLGRIVAVPGVRSGDRDVQGTER